jgi:hypothetical protein
MTSSQINSLLFLIFTSFSLCTAQDVTTLSSSLVVVVVVLCVYKNFYLMMSEIDLNSLNETRCEIHSVRMS